MPYLTKTERFDLDCIIKEICNEKPVAKIRADGSMNYIICSLARDKKLDESKMDLLLNTALCTLDNLSYQGLRNIYAEGLCALCEIVRRAEDWKIEGSHLDYLVEMISDRCDVFYEKVVAKYEDIKIVQNGDL